MCVSMCVCTCVFLLCWQGEGEYVCVCVCIENILSWYIIYGVCVSVHMCALCVCVCSVCMCVCFSSLYCWQGEGEYVHECVCGGGCLC